MKDRLIELLSNAPVDFDGNRNVCKLAEHLLANGVVIMDMSVVSPKNRPLISKIAEHQIDEVIDIITAKEEGCIFVPPCKVGDTVFYFDDYYKRIDELTITGVESVINCKSKKGGLRAFSFSALGKSLFLTKDAAEHSLKKERRCK